MTTVQLSFGDTSLIWTPHVYAQFALSLGKKCHYIFYLNSTRLMWTPREHGHFLWPPQCPY